MSAGLIRHLKAKTEQDSNTAILLAQWEFDQKLVGKALENIASYYPHFSSHNASHSHQILVNIERLLDKNIIELSATDTWLLLESAYWHDVGMLFNSQQVQDIIKDSKFKEYVETLANDNSQDLHEFAKKWHDTDWKQALAMYDHPQKGVEKYRQMVAEWYRRDHAKNSQRVVADPFEILGINSPRTELLPKRIYRYLGQICLAHGTSFESVMSQLPYRQTGMGTENCHPRFVACMLRLGDLFDIDDNRFCPVMMKQTTMPKLSEAHHHKHLAIREFQLDNKTVSITAECEDEDAYIQTQMWFGWIKEEMQNQMSQWKNIVPNRSFGLLPTIQKLDVVMTSSKILLNNKPMKFGLDEKSAIELLQGRNLYDDETNIYRELIQNAVDATYLRVWIEHGMRKREITDDFHPFHPKFQEILENYPITIDFVKLEDEPNSDYSIWQFSLTDNGTGISLKDLEYMQKIAGSSRNVEKKRLMADMPVWMRPSGAFGIGLHSAFLLLDKGREEDNKIVLETKSIADNASYRIEMTSPISGNQGYCFIEKLSDEENLKRDYGTKLNINIRVERKGRRYFYLSDEFKENILINKYQKEFDTLKTPIFDFSKILFITRKIREKIITNISVPIEFKHLESINNTNGNAITNPINSFTPNHILRIWYGKENLYVSLINLSQVDSLTFFESSFRCMTYFKGQEIDRLSVNIIPSDMDFFGFNAKESLQIDRNKWSKNFLETLEEKNYFFELNKNIIIDNYSDIKEHLSNSKVMSALLYYYKIEYLDNSIKDLWKEMKLTTSHNVKYSANLDISYKGLISLDQFTIEEDTTVNGNYINNIKIEDLPNNTIVVSNLNNHNYFYENFVNEWYKSGGDIIETKSEEIRTFKLRKINQTNNLLFEHLKNQLKSNVTRIILDSDEIRDYSLNYLEDIICFSEAHENFLGNNTNREKVFLSPFAFFRDDEKAIIAVANFEFLCQSVFDELKKNGKYIRLDSIKEKYEKFISQADELMKNIPEWVEAREMGRDFIPKDIRELEDMFKPSDEVLKAYESEKEKRK